MSDLQQPWGKPDPLMPDANDPVWQTLSTAPAEPAMYPEPPPTAGGPRCRHEVVRWQAHDLFPDIEHDIDSGWDARLTCAACGEFFVTWTYAQHLQNIIRDREQRDQANAEAERFDGMTPTEIVAELKGPRA